MFASELGTPDCSPVLDAMYEHCVPPSMKTAPCHNMKIGLMQALNLPYCFVALDFRTGPACKHCISHAALGLHLQSALHASTVPAILLYGLWILELVQLQVSAALIILLYVFASYYWFSCMQAPYLASFQPKGPN
jgi:hypothetical protein